MLYIPNPFFRVIRLILHALYRQVIFFSVRKKAKGPIRSTSPFAFY
jgi:hypothetical protein